MRENNELKEQVLRAWVGLTGVIKNNRMTTGLTYNEAIVLMYAYQRFCEDGVGEIAVKEIIEKTRMLKSLINRTVDSLVEQGYLAKARGDADGRTVFVRIAKERLSDFMEVHNHSLSIVERVVSIIGEEDAKAFVRIYEKLAVAKEELL